MSNIPFPIKINAELPINKLEKGLFVFMYRATRIPPHLGIIFNGKLYDITLQEPNLGVDASEFLTSVIKKFTKTIFFEIQGSPNLNTQEIESILLKNITRFRQVSENISCIAPIKEIFREIYSINIQNVEFIFELLPLLKKNKLIKNTYHLNLERNITENIFLLT
ncbi:MAG: hypothetical protein CVT95_11135, partial [Bacteroidetes bacterium HGW-Bacteroidetes-12]